MPDPTATPPETPSTPPNGSAGSEPYVMTISRLTVDKLGVKLYDTVSAAVAELVANSYDADATKVTIRTPVSVLLSPTTTATIEVEDDGHGMTPEEARKQFLRVGRDRRREPAGSASRTKKRPVMGRKGIGKLAPFGICKRIEVISAGGSKTDKGFEITNFIMNFDDIVQDTDTLVVFDPGPLDRQFQATSGTTIRLSVFLNKRVPSLDVLERQIARRFAIDPQALAITIEQPSGEKSLVPVFEVPMEESTIIDVSKRPVVLDDGTELPVTGKVGMATRAYWNEEMAGVRIYARGKIVATTRDFERPAGFTGEFTTRSYLVGDVTAPWLDLDTGDDLVRTDRQGILWESEYGGALRKWGAELIKEIAAATRVPRRKNARQKFFEKSDFEDRAKKAFVDTSVVDAAIDLAGKIGSFAAEDELEDQQYIDDLSDVILSVAPHKALIEALKEFSEKATKSAISLTQLSNLFGKSRIAEMAAYSQIAAERVRIVEELETIVFATPAHDEAVLQKLITEAPWLIEPAWAAITENKGLNTFAKALSKFLSEQSKKTVLLTFDKSGNRPDFILVSVSSMMHIVELKKVDHDFDDTDCERLLPYFDWLDTFFTKNPELVQEYPRGYRIDLIADGVKLSKTANRRALDSLEKDGKYKRRSWHDFLVRAKKAHAMFLEARNAGKP